MKKSLHKKNNKKHEIGLMTSITLLLSLNILANENLYKPMDEKKINEAIKTLKPKIRSGIDNNSNEMIKCTSDLIVNKIKVIFNPNI